MDSILSLVKNLLKEFSFSPNNKLLHWQEFKMKFREYYFTGKEFTEDQYYYEFESYGSLKLYSNKIQANKGDKYWKMSIYDSKNCNRKY